MKRTLRYMEFGAIYGSYSLAAMGCLVALYMAIENYFFLWPKDVTIIWFLAGMLGVFFGNFMVGSFFGYLGGIVFGLFASIARNQFGWIISGLLGGAVSSLCLFWLRCFLSRNPVIITPSLVLFCLVPILVFATIGFFIGREINRDNPKIPYLNIIQEW